MKSLLISFGEGLDFNRRPWHDRERGNRMNSTSGLKSLESAQLKFEQRNLSNLAEDLGSLVRLAQERFELHELEDRPRSDTI